MLRKCLKCGEEKELDLFRKRKNNIDGRGNTCKLCHAKQYRTGKPNTGRFQKGRKSEHGFKKGHTLSPFKGGVPQEYRDRIDFGKGSRGRKQTPEEIAKRSESMKATWAKKDRNNGRRSVRNRQWSADIIERDGGKCTRCGVKEGLHAHHIKTWNEYPEERFNLDNGITLCRICHGKVEHEQNPRPAWNKGKKLSDEHKESLSESHKGLNPWNKGKEYIEPKERECTVCKEVKDIECFTPQGKWRTKMCKACRNAMLSKRRQEATV